VTARLTLLPDRNAEGRDKELVLGFESEAGVEAWVSVLAGACDPTRTTYEGQTGKEEETEGFRCKRDWASVWACRAAGRGRVPGVVKRPDLGMTAPHGRFTAGEYTHCVVRRLVGV
jgi:hypothetical protein